MLLRQQTRPIRLVWNGCELTRCIDASLLQGKLKIYDIIREEGRCHKGQCSTFSYETLSLLRRHPTGCARGRQADRCQMSRGSTHCVIVFPHPCANCSTHWRKSRSTSRFSSHSKSCPSIKRSLVLIACVSVGFNCEDVGHRLPTWVPISIGRRRPSHPATAARAPFRHL